MTKVLPDSRFFRQYAEKITAFAVGIISLACYWITTSPDVAFWDCPEYVTVASRLEIGHPPGNPFWALAMRVAVMFFPPQYHALIINLCSGVFMALAGLFLTRVIFFCTRKVLSPGFSPQNNLIISSTASFCGGLSYSLCWSAWFSAIESEVYAMSAFFTAFILWLMIKWFEEKEAAKARRILYLVIYLSGLSLGVHELGLLCLPVYGLIWSLKRYPRLHPGKRFLQLVFFLGIVGFLLIGFTGGLYSLASVFELVSVNEWGFSYMSGVFIYICLLVFAFIIAVKSLDTGKKFLVFLSISLFLFLSGIFILNDSFIIAAILSLISGFIAVSVKIRKYLRAALLGMVLMMTGYSSFAIIEARSMAMPLMNQGNPSDIFNLKNYVTREQYGKNPLFYGRTPFSRPMLAESYDPDSGLPEYNRFFLEKEHPRFIKVLNEPRIVNRSGFMNLKDSLNNKKIINKSHGYLKADYKYRYLFTPELNMFFPRMTQGGGEYMSEYEKWAGMKKENMQEVIVSEVVDTLGNYNLRIDDSGKRVSKKEYRPTYLQQLKYLASYQLGYMYFRYLGWNYVGRSDEEGRNLPMYFGIPLIIGIFGMAWLLCRRKRGIRIFESVLLFMFMTGPAIVLYLNQTPLEPRERDYTFLGSYMGFSIFIGMGIAALAGIIMRLKTSGALKTPLILVLALALPIFMGCENFRDNDRRLRNEPYLFSAEILSSSYPSIFISQGDNNSFPLWYTQEVRGEGTEHIVLEWAYLSSPEYIVNLMKQGERGLKLIAKPEQIGFYAYAFVNLPSEDSYEAVPLDSLLREVYESEEENPCFLHSTFRIPGDDKTIYDLRDFTGGKNQVDFRTLMILDIIASNALSPEGRSVYFLNGTHNLFSQAPKNLYRPALFGKVIEPLKNKFNPAERMIEDLHKYEETRERITGERIKKPEGKIDQTLENQMNIRADYLLEASRFLKSQGFDKESSSLDSIAGINYSYQ